MLNCFEWTPACAGVTKKGLMLDCQGTDCKGAAIHYIPSFRRTAESRSGAVGVS